MRLFRLLIVLSGIFIISVNAQNKLTLDDAIDLAIKNNLELHKQKALLNRVELRLDETRLLPNPVFSYSREDLKDNQFNYGEWIASGSIPINFLWSRWSNIESKKNMLEAQKLFYDHNKMNIVAEVQEVYLSFNNYSFLSENLKSSLSKLSNLAEASKHKVTEGDISEYELQRILIEINRLRSTVSELELRKKNYESRLRLLIGYDRTKEITTESLNIKSHFHFSKDELITQALKNRKDLSAASLLIESENLFLSHNKIKAIPEINLTAGYKEQTDNMKGTIFQINFEVPLFNRNQIAIEQTEIELNLLEREKTFLIEKIKSDVSEALEKLTMVQNLHKSQDELQFMNIFNSAIYSYEQGEISLVEFIDGINAYIDGVVLAKKLETDFYQSVFELEKLVSISLTNYKEKR
ncbi:MAG: hypothetical protein C0425_09410 [Chlorobiaceae bacterium]|nr:hypothetical protein [Chlorobiaceae bacterium]MBA4310538.1 hypothetical protein [Chlorobiaceae bacterium]